MVRQMVCPIYPTCLPEREAYVKRMDDGRTAEQVCAHKHPHDEVELGCEEGYCPVLKKTISCVEVNHVLKADSQKKRSILIW